MDGVFKLRPGGFRAARGHWPLLGRLDGVSTLLSINDLVEVSSCVHLRQPGGCIGAGLRDAERLATFRWVPGRLTVLAQRMRGWPPPPLPSAAKPCHVWKSGSVKTCSAIWMPLRGKTKPRATKLSVALWPFTLMPEPKSIKAVPSFFSLPRERAGKSLPCKAPFSFHHAKC